VVTGVAALDTALCAGIEAAVEAIVEGAVLRKT
jgi:hypothetical protein